MSCPCELNNTGFTYTLAMSDVNKIAGVFVYGTLKPGLHNYYLAERAGALTYQPGFIEGFELYHLEPENYPAIVAGAGRVYGGVLAFEDIGEAFGLLDELEGVNDTPPLYRRQLVDVTLKGGRATAWVYTYALSFKREGALRVASGEWQPVTGRAPSSKEL